MADEQKVQTREERIEELLNQSSMEAASAIKGPSLADHVSEETKIVEEVVATAEEEETDSGGKKVRIPASRLKTLTSRLDEAETKRLEDKRAYEERVAALEAQIKADKEEDLPEWWVEAYGDNEVSRQGYKNQVRIMREETKRVFAEQEAQRQAEEAEREARLEAIGQSFDEQMDELEESLGRTLTASQKTELLDIVGEYSPQDNGRYIAYLPIEKAYDIWSKSQTTDAGKQEMARMGGIQSTGSTTVAASVERPQWGDWRKRFGA